MSGEIIWLQREQKDLKKSEEFKTIKSMAVEERNWRVFATTF